MRLASPPQPYPAPGETVLEGPWRFFAFMQRPWFAYALLLLLQLKVVWGAWDYREMTSGDTSSYYVDACVWYEKWTGNIAWSPLYTAFYGSLHHLTTNPRTVTLLHRLLLVFAVSTLALALFRRLLPPGIAWLAAAWWTILPINFNTLYEVHLFAVLPALTVWLLIQVKDTPWARGAALATLALSAVLVRNEMAVAAGLLALTCAVWEFHRICASQAAPRPQLPATLAAYLVPLAIAWLICYGFYQRSPYKYPELDQVLQAKHRLNMAQVYSFGYQQRHPEWQGNPWTGYQDLVRRDFGQELPSLGEMIRVNPRAVADHFLWNFRLVPNGLQVLLFNSAWGKCNPDYAPIQTRSQMALVLSLVLLAVWALGITLAVKEWRFWWESWFRGRLLTLLTMLCVATVVIPIIATQRPRPSYLFALGIFLMALTGMWIYVIFSRFAFLKRLSVVMPAVMVGLFFYVPSYYADPARRQQPRVLSQTIERLRPYQALLTDPTTNFLKGEFCWEVSSYLGHARCKSYDYGLLNQRSPGQTLDAFLDSRTINLFYLDENLLSRLAAEDPVSAEVFLGNTGNARWKLVACQDVPGERWKLFRRSLCSEEVFICGLYRDVMGREAYPHEIKYWEGRIAVLGSREQLSEEFKACWKAYQAAHQ